MSYLPTILKERAENDRIRRESLTDEQFVRDDYGSNGFYGGEYDGVMSDLSGGDGSRDHEQRFSRLSQTSLRHHDRVQASADAAAAEAAEGPPSPSSFDEQQQQQWRPQEEDKEDKAKRQQRHSRNSVEEWEGGGVGFGGSSRGDDKRQMAHRRGPDNAHDQPRQQAQQRSWESALPSQVPSLPPPPKIQIQRGSVPGSSRRYPGPVKQPLPRQSCVVS